MPTTSEPDPKRRRRELIRANHPDRGGDPAVFIALLQSLDEEPRGEPPTEVRFVRRRRWRVPNPRRRFRRNRPKRVL
jgi:hypothetical protein